MIERWGQWLDEGMDHSPWLGMARLVGSVALYEVIATGVLYFGLALVGVDVGLG